MVLHCVLQDHDFKYLLGLGMGKFALGDEGAYADRQGMDTLIGELADIREKLIPKVPEMLLGFDSHSSSIKGIPGHLLMLQSDGPIVNKGLESLSILTLKYHLQLLPACAPVISFISIDVKGFQVVMHPVVEDFPVLQLIGGIKVEFGSFPAVIGVRGHSCMGKCWGSTGELPDWETRGWLGTREWLGTRGNCYLALQICLNVRGMCYVLCKCGDVRGKS